MQIIKNYIYFYHLLKYYYIPVTPDELSDVMQSSFSSTSALSRSAPVFTYSNSGPRTVSVSLPLHRDMMRDLSDGTRLVPSNFIGPKNQLHGVGHAFRSKIDTNASKISEDYIDNLIKALQAAALPNYNQYSANSKVVVPPMVAIRLGDDIFIKGVINGSVSVSRRKPIMNDGKYSNVVVSFTVEEVDPYTANQVAKFGSFRGYIRGDIR